MLLTCLCGAAVLLSLGLCALTGVFSSLNWLWVLPLSAVGFFVLLAVGAFLYLYYLSKKVDQDVPQEKDDPKYRRVVDLYLEAIVPIVRIHIQTSGMEKVPKDGRFLLVCNHCSNLDPIILMRCFPKQQLAFISKKENRDMFIVGPLMHKLLGQLINRENDREALKTILRCIQILKEDQASVAVFPEGGILSKDGKLHTFRPGVFKIAQKAKVPIVVCTLHNTLPVIPNMKHLRRSDVQMNLLEVIPAEELQGVTTVDIAKRVHGIMAADMGPDMLAE